MLDLPARFAGLIPAFAQLFVHRSWRHAGILLIGTILAPRRRTVKSVLHTVSRAHERRFVNVYRILSPAHHRSCLRHRGLAARWPARHAAPPAADPRF